MTNPSPPCHPDKVIGLSDEVYIRQACTYIDHHGYDVINTFNRKHLKLDIESGFANDTWKYSYKGPKAPTKNTTRTRPGPTPLMGVISGYNLTLGEYLRNK